MKTSDILLTRWKALVPSKTDDEGVRALTLYAAYETALENEAKHGWQDALTADVKEYGVYFVRATPTSTFRPAMLRFRGGEREWWGWDTRIIFPTQVYINQEDINANETK